MRHLLLPVVLFLSTTISGCVMWAPARGIPEGALEARLSGALFYGDTSSDDLADNFRADVAVLYALTPRFQLGPMFEWGIGEVEIGGIQVVDREMLNFGLQALYCFQPQGQMTPYGVINVGTVNVDSDNGFEKTDDDGLFGTLGFGLRAQVNRSFAVHGEMRVTHRDLDRSVGGDWAEAGLFLGCSYVFGGRQDPEPEADEPARESPWRQPGEVLREDASAPLEKLWQR